MSKIFGAAKGLDRNKISYLKRSFNDSENCYAYVHALYEFIFDAFITFKQLNSRVKRKDAAASTTTVQGHLE